MEIFFLFLFLSPKINVGIAIFDRMLYNKISFNLYLKERHMDLI